MSVNKCAGVVDEIHQYIDGLNLSSPLSDEGRRRAYQISYRYFHCLLIWRHILAHYGKSRPSAAAIEQFDELLSDLSNCQMLWLAGMYKPARMMLRSSIENLLRVVALEQKLSTQSAKFTFELVALVKASKIGVSSSPVRGDLDRLIQLYSELCVYTHASKTEYLSLRVPFQSLMQFEQSDFASLNEDFKNITQRINRIMFGLYSRILRQAPHDLSDPVLDALPKSLKRVAS